MFDLDGSNLLDFDFTNFHGHQLTSPDQLQVNSLDGKQPRSQLVALWQSLLCSPTLMV